MDRSCDQLFARTGFSLDQHAGVGGGYNLNLPQHALQRRAPADNLFEVQLTADLIFKVNPFLAEAVFQLPQFPVNQRILNRDRYLARHLQQKVDCIPSARIPSMRSRPASGMTQLFLKPATDHFGSPSVSSSSISSEFPTQGL